MDSSLNNREKGKLAENIAVKYLQDKGYQILKTNFQFGKVGEIDIVAKYDDILVFVEVKSKTNPNYGEPIEALTLQKAKQVRKVAEAYLYVNKIEDMECRLDFIGIDLTQQIPRVKHLKAAF